MISYWMAFFIAVQSLCLGHIIGRHMSSKDRRKLRLWPYMINTLSAAERRLPDKDKQLIKSIIEVAESIDEQIYDKGQV